MDGRVVGLLPVLVLMLHALTVTAQTVPTAAMLEYTLGHTSEELIVFNVTRSEAVFQADTCPPTGTEPKPALKVSPSGEWLWLPGPGYYYIANKTVYRSWLGSTSVVGSIQSDGVIYGVGGFTYKCSRSTNGYIVRYVSIGFERLTPYIDAQLNTSVVILDPWSNSTATVLLNVTNGSPIPGTITLYVNGEELQPGDCAVVDPRLVTVCAGYDRYLEGYGSNEVLLRVNTKRMTQVEGALTLDLKILFKPDGAGALLGAELPGLEVALGGQQDTAPTPGWVAPVAVVALAIILVAVAASRR